jgi:GNAT superfamily N-acetyltransferase
VSGPAPSESSAVGAARTDRGEDIDGHGVGAPTPPRLCWCVRPATHQDIPTVVEAVQELLHELGGTPPPKAAMQAAARALLDSPQAGALLVMEADGRMADAEYNHAIVGVLCVSWQTAVHVPGRYALIQDLWVHPLWRGKAIGRELLTALYALARELQIARVEVGLPREDFEALAATQAFYQANGFAPLGPRMRRGLT